MKLISLTLFLAAILVLSGVSWGQRPYNEPSRGDQAWGYAEPLGVDQAFGPYGEPVGIGRAPGGAWGPFTEPNGFAWGPFIEPSGGAWGPFTEPNGFVWWPLTVT